MNSPFRGNSMALKEKTIEYRRRTIVRDLIIWLTIAVSSTVIIQIVIYYLYSTHVSKQELNAKAESMIEELREVLAISMWNLNQNVVQQISNAYLKSPYLAGIHVVDDLGNVMFDQVPQDELSSILPAVFQRQYREFGKGYLGIVFGKIRAELLPED